MVAVYVFDVSMVIGGAVFHDGLVSLALGLLGHPAAAATLSAVSWALAAAAVVGVVEGFFEPPPLVTKTEIPMMTPRATTTMIVRRISCLRFFALAAAALLAS